LRFALLTEGQDPDDLLRAGGKDKLSQLLNQAIPLLDFLWQSETRQRSLDTPERQAALRQRLFDLSRSIEHAEVRQSFHEAFRQQLRNRFGTGASKKAAKPSMYIAPDGGRGVGGTRLAAWIENAATTGERQLLGPLVVHPDLLPDVEEELAAVVFTDPALEMLRQEIISWYSESEDLDRDRLNNHLCTNGFAKDIEPMTDRRPASVATAWYCRADAERADILEAWRARLAQYRQFGERRGIKQAASEAITGMLEDEARVQLLTTDRLLNIRDIKTKRGGRS